MSFIGKFRPSQIASRIRDAEWEEPVGGMELITPTSVGFVGTSATTQGLDGAVTFTSCTYIYLNGIFGSTYNNYMLSIQCKSTSTSVGIIGRLRSDGTDETAANSYTHQGTSVSGSTSTGTRLTSDYWLLFNSYNVSTIGSNIMIFGPYLKQQTAFLASSNEDISSASMADYVGTHRTPQSYSSFTLQGGIPYSGTISVYGLIS
jgi:hypothetical protein